MLKALLVVAGVVFIGLGVFGGKLFEGNKGASSGSLIQVEVPASNDTSIRVADAGQVPVVSDSNSIKVVAVSDGTQAQELQAAVEVTSASPIIVESQDTVLAQEGAEPIAPAQAAGDLLAMAEQAKSSSRNEQVDIAQAVLASNKSGQVQVKTAPGATLESVGKSDEANSVIVTTAGGIDTEELVVLKDRVNMREGPSIDHPVVLTLEQGQELMEFKRQGKWVNVGAYGTSGKIGWVHERLVSVSQ